MARNTFGGTSADVSENNAGTRLPNLKGKVFDQPSGGVEVTDLLDAQGIHLDALVSDYRGMVPEFQGPDGTERLWVEFNDGRVMLVANNSGERLSRLLRFDDEKNVEIPTGGKLTVSPQGDVTTPGVVTARNVGTSRVFAGADDPQTQGVTPVLGDVWVRLNRQDQSEARAEAKKPAPAVDTSALEEKIAAAERTATKANTRVDQVERKLNSLQEKRASAEQLVERAGSRLDSLERKTGDIQDQLRKNQANANQQSATVGQQVAKANARLDVLEPKVVSLQASIGELGDASEAGVLKRLSDVESGLKDAKRSVSKVGELDQRFTELSDKATPALEKVNKVTALEKLVLDLQKLTGPLIMPSDGTEFRSLQERIFEVETTVLSLMQLMRQRGSGRPSGDAPSVVVGPDVTPAGDEPSDSVSGKDVEGKSAADPEA